MHYRVTYLAIQERESMLLLAPDAATAVAMAERTFSGAPQAFELISVTPEPDASETAAGDITRASTGLIR
jgi:hypothetical protein